MHLALGGVAEINPGGTEIGKVTVDLTDFARKHLKTERKTFDVYLGHRDHVPKMAAGFENLGSTAPTPIQGGILGNEMLSWQVHPELPAELMLAFLISQKNGSLTMNGVG
jgi:GMP synthase-like glutamine amidotransferase